MTLSSRPSMLLFLLFVGCLALAPLLVAPLPTQGPPGGGMAATATASATAVPSPTATPSPTPTPSPTATPLPTATPTVTPVPVPVHVLRSYPIDGDTDVLPEAPLRIIFDQPMDPAPEALRLSVTPDLPLRGEWTAPDALALHTAPRQPGTVYHLTLVQARGQSGGTLAQPFSLSFAQGGNGAPLPILMYHHVAVLAPNAAAGQKEWAVSPEALAAQLDLLAGLGGHVVPLIEVVDYLSHGAPLPARPVAITFDDGNIDALRNAVPILQARHLPATFFVPPQYAESGNREFMTWDDVRALAASGFALGGHSYQHAYVQDLTPAQAEHQIGDEKRKLEELTGAHVDCFAYPFGAYSQKTIEQLQHYGYRAALTITQRVYQKPGDIFRLGRIRMGYDDPLERLRQKLPWRE